MHPDSLAGGGPPPQLLALLHAAQGGGAPQAQAPAPEQGTGSAEEREPIAILKQMIQLASRYISVEPDDEDKATMAKVQATLHQYLAKEQQDNQAVMGNPATQRVLRKAG